MVAHRIELPSETNFPGSVSALIEQIFGGNSLTQTTYWQRMVEMTLIHEHVGSRKRQTLKINDIFIHSLGRNLTSSL